MPRLSKRADGRSGRGRNEATNPARELGFAFFLPVGSQEASGKTLG
jgi:hypothetical protein